MATISKPNTFSAGATIIASEHNNNFDTIYNDYNGGISNANISGSAAIDDTKLDLATIAQNITMAGTLTVTNDVILGGGATDSLIINCNDGVTYTPAATWTFTANQTVSGIWADLGSVTTIDINGGTVNGLSSLGLSTGTDITEISVDGTLAGDSDNAVPTEKATKTYVDANKTSWGAYAAGTFGSSTQAVTDIMVIGIAQKATTTIGEFSIKTDSSNPPTTVRARISQTADNAWVTISVPVRSGEYYLIEDIDTQFDNESVLTVPLS